jgi:bifunctional UDP-N-acetylglucosamine pyrophosphorylase/glucosamine-1-phosphate N-acetyltransferase
MKDFDTKDFTAVILAAGLGKRMKSDLPKVLFSICGKTLVEYVVDHARQAGFEKIVVVVGHGADQVKAVLGDSVRYALQAEQLGTGHAVMMAKDHVDTRHVIVLSGDAPLLAPDTLRSMARHHLEQGAAATVLTAVMDNPERYGRILRENNAPDGKVTGIIEERDASPDQLMIKEINTGTYCFESDVFSVLDECSRSDAGRQNAQGEYYLTDALAAYYKAGRVVAAVVLPDPHEGDAPNNRVQLAETAKVIQQRILEELMLSGVTIVDPHNTYVDITAKVGRDSTLMPGTIIEGDTVIGERCQVGPFTHLKNVQIGNDVVVQHSVLIDCIVKDRVNIGPYAYIRPESVIEQGAKVGDFVEIKKSIVGENSKVPHLSYVGDATIGKGSNIGAGTITCNYDGKYKHHTEIGDGVFIGSNSNLVAPVNIGDGAYVAAGSTITDEVPGNALAIARARQVNKENYVRKQK